MPGGEPMSDAWVEAHRAGHHAHGGVPDCPLCPRPAGPDPARDERVAKRRAEDARAASRGLDRLLYEQGFEDGIRYAEVRRMFADLPRHEPVHEPVHGALCQCSVCAPELYKSGE